LTRNIKIAWKSLTIAVLGRKTLGSTENEVTTKEVRRFLFHLYKTTKMIRNLLTNAAAARRTHLSMLENADKNGLIPGSIYKIEFAERFLLFTSEGFLKKR